MKITLSKIHRDKLCVKTLVILVLFVLSTFFTMVFTEPVQYVSAEQSEVNTYKKDISDSFSKSIVITAGDISEIEGDAIEIGEHEGKEDVLIWNTYTGHVTYEVSVRDKGDYNIYVEYMNVPDSVDVPERAIEINGVSQNMSNSYFVLNRVYTDTEYPFRQDDEGNDIRSAQEEVIDWLVSSVDHPLGYQAEPLKFSLDAGSNMITLSGRKGSVVISRLLLVPVEEIPSYENYREQIQESETTGFIETFEAENINKKTSKSIQPVYLAEPKVLPEAVGVIKLNAMGGTRWRFPGEWASWEIDVPETGSYQVAFKYKQHMNQNVSVFRTISVNGTVPFRELYNVEFPYSTKWENKVIGEDEPYLIHLEKGLNTISLKVTCEPYSDVIESIEALSVNIRELDFQIKEITGVDASGKVDRYKIWNLENYIPDITERLEGFVEEIYSNNNALKKILSIDSDVFNVLESSANDLQRYAEDTEKIPHNPDALTTVQMSLVTWLEDLKFQPLLLDSYQVKTQNEEFDSVKVGFWETLTYTLRNFFASFNKESMTSGRTDDDVIQVWVQRNRDYVNLMQEHSDLYFTPESGIEANINYIPNHNVLILANAAGEQPDIASGLVDNTIFEFSLRNATIDLNRFPEYSSMKEEVIPGSLRPYHLDNKDFGFPEEAIFNMLFYREDILNDLGLEPPDTWDELLEMIPTIQQYNMNIYFPWGNFDPFLFQNGLDFYSEDGMEVGFNNAEGYEAFKFWTDVYIRYGLPHRAVSFYQHFRQGSMPIGIAPINQYVLFQLAAPDISGLWKMLPIPGIMTDDGEIVRWQAGMSTGGGERSKGAMMFKSDPEKEERVWEFMKWWLSSQTQSQFSVDLENYYGIEFRWFPTNKAAFSSIPWSPESRESVSAQMDWYKDVPNVPGGSYMALREIRNAWTRTVIDKGNYREEFDKAIQMINRELLRKYTEFGFIDEEGNIIKTNPLISDIERKTDK